MSDLALPPQILADVVEALYRTHVETLELQGDPLATLAAFETHVGRRYPRLFASRKGILSHRVVKAFLLFEQSQEHPSGQIIDELTGLLEAEDRTRLLVPGRKIEPSSDTDVTTPISDPLSVVAADADEAFDDLQYDRAFVFYLALPLSRKSISRLIHCADFIGTKDISNRLVAKFAEAEPSLIDSLPPVVQAKIADLTVAASPVSPPPEEAKGIEDAHDQSMRTASVPVPVPVPVADSWMTWAEQLSGGVDLAGAERAVQSAVTNWNTKSLRATASQSLLFAELIGNLNGDAAAVARRSVPQIFRAVFPQDGPAIQGTKPIASLLFTLIAIGDALSAPDLEVLSQLVDILIGLGLSNEEYITLVSDLDDVQERVRSYAHLAWSLDISETLAVSPANSDAGRAARLGFFMNILGQAQAFAHRLGPQDLLPMDLLAKDYDVGQNAIDVLRRPQNDGPVDSASVDLSGTIIGIYTLAETAGSRAKASLEKMFPGCSVTINSDTVATERLRSLARSANLFVFAWRSSSHAAFYCIKDALPNGEPIWAAGKGTASIIRAVLDNIK